MYKDQQKWLEIALIILDAVISGFAFILAGIMRYGSIIQFSYTVDFIELMFVTILFSGAAFIIAKMYNKFSTRGYLRELHHVMIYSIVMVLFMALYSFITKNGIALSRLTLLYFFIINAILLYCAHIIIKKSNSLRFRKRQDWKLLIISDADHVIETCRDIKDSDWKERAIGVIMIDDQHVEDDQLCGIPLIDSPGTCMNYITQNTVDQVLVSVSKDQYWSDEVKSLLSKIAATGVIVGLKNCLPFCDEDYVYKLTKIADSYVLSYANREYDYLMILLKRAMDILGGFVGSVLAILIGMVLAPFILIESPGPLFFKQERVGRNGRIFSMLKFRSMYADAEERKAALMKKNKMKGLLFKIEDDPRITKVGKFIRKTSLDEFPQFFNVLIGDMSLVGIRPPTLDEYKQYDYYHKKRLSFRPGITGIWQTSGRNDITDFEEVMKMDLEYIKDWSIYLDVKLLLKTVLTVLFGKGAG